MNDMICICCNQKLQAIFNEPYYKQPSKALHFYTYGHYGSTYFDPMDGSSLHIFVCDSCLEKNQNKILTDTK